MKDIDIIIFFFFSLFLFLGINSFYFYSSNHISLDNINISDPCPLSLHNITFPKEDNVYIPFIDYWLVHLIITIVIEIIIFLLFFKLINKGFKNFSEVFTAEWDKMDKLINEYVIRLELLECKDRQVISIKDQINDNFRFFRKSYQETPFFFIFPQEKKERLLPCLTFFFSHTFFAFVFILLMEAIISLIIFLRKKNKYPFFQIFKHGIKRLIPNKKDKKISHLVIIFFFLLIDLFIYFFVDSNCGDAVQEEFFLAVSAKDEKTANDRFRTFFNRRRILKQVERKMLSKIDSEGEEKN